MTDKVTKKVSSVSRTSGIARYLRVLPEVATAVQAGQPVVALESSIIAQGMPYPRNVELALSLQNTLRAVGVVPATMAILQGRLCVGLSNDEIEALGKSNKPVLKVSRRDLAYAVSEKLDGATTVASTLWMAHQAGIPVFATGGIGGVHRGAEESYDVSADLHELAQTPGVVVSAGAKAILDLPKTLELLETLGVPVVGFGTHAFPAFYSRESGLRSGFRLDSAEQVARLFLAQRDLGLSSAIILANPIPAEHEIPQPEMESYIAQALKELTEQKVTGKNVTPFLLSRIVALTQERSLQANVRLVENNVRLAGDVAKSLSHIKRIEKSE